MRIDENDHQQLAELLVGRRVMKVSDHSVKLDDGTTLKFIGNEGCGGCENGHYPLTELNGVDNIITNAWCVHAPVDENDPGRKGHGYYKIFVFAGDRTINLATFRGTDGNGWYGTGFEIAVSWPGKTRNEGK